MKIFKQRLYIEFETVDLDEVKDKLKEYSDWNVEGEKDWVEYRKHGYVICGKILLTKEE